MPTRSSERWIADGANVKEQLEALGYEVDLQYAEDDIPTQVNQLDNMITQGAKLLVIASIDGTALTSQLEAAAENNIPVIAYDRLIRDSEHVDYYATFDNFEVGVQQATSVLVGLDLLDKDGNEGDAEGPFNIELFAGSPDDNNATFFFEGAMSILQPYIDDGTLVVKSGQTDSRPSRFCVGTRRPLSHVWKTCSPRRTRQVTRLTLFSRRTTVCRSVFSAH